MKPITLCTQGGWVDVSDLSSPSISYWPMIRHQLPWIFPISQSVINAQTIPEHMTPASSSWSQLFCSQPGEVHFHKWDSFPVQFTSSSQMRPDPAPKWANTLASRPSPQPSCLHTTFTSFKSQLSSQTVPQEPWWRISTLPAHRLPPFTRRSRLLSEERVRRRHLHREGEGFSGPMGPLPEQLAALSSEAAEPAGSDRESLHWGSTWL